MERDERIGGTTRKRAGSGGRRRLLARAGAALVLACAAALLPGTTQGQTSAVATMQARITVLPAVAAPVADDWRVTSAAGGTRVLLERQGPPVTAHAGAAVATTTTLRVVGAAQCTALPGTRAALACPLPVGAERAAAGPAAPLRVEAVVVPAGL